MAVRAQRSDRMWRIGVLTSLPADDRESLARVMAFLQGLQELGWTVGRNVQIDYRWVAGEVERYRSTQPIWLRSRRTLSSRVTARPSRRYSRHARLAPRLDSSRIVA
jgi:hypothetical protein